MSPSEDRPNSRINQGCCRSAPHRRARSRRCLLKGCNRVYHSEHPLQRYCSETCRQKAKKWHRYKAQQKYRETARGKARRQEQCRRRRKLGKARKAAADAAAGGARVIPIRFFRPGLRSARLLRKVPENPALSPAAFLLARMPARAGARFGAGTTLEGTGSGARVRVDERRTEPIAAWTESPSRSSRHIVNFLRNRYRHFAHKERKGGGTSLSGAFRSLFFFMSDMRGT